MSDKHIVIVGSGIAGTTLAWNLAGPGTRITVIEKGRDYPYPHAAQFEVLTMEGREDDSQELPLDLKNHTRAGDYSHNIEEERFMWTGGSATRWEALTPRMVPEDFRTKTAFGYGTDWPVSYEELEPYYLKAENHIGVSGTYDDNPFAPPRSGPLPLPPFALSYDDKILADQLAAKNIKLHTTPQARTSLPYGDRAGCLNFGQCRSCPVGARYSPTHHLNAMARDGRVKLLTETSVRRVVTDATGRATGVVVRANTGSRDEEMPADVVIVAAGAIESARLLLLSKDAAHPNGLGNAGGWVGAHLGFHHIWRVQMRLPKDLFPGRVGAWTAQTHQFINHAARGRAGAIKIEFTSQALRSYKPNHRWKNADELLEDMRPMLRTRPLALHAESLPDDGKRVTLSDKPDRFGDPLPAIQYQSNAFDYETYQVSSGICTQFAEATGASGPMPPAGSYVNGAHHMGTCRMGQGPADGVASSFGQVHGSPNTFIAGPALFVGCSGAMNPTLTATALAIRSSDFIREKLLA